MNSVTKDFSSSPSSSRRYTSLQFGSRQGARQPSNFSQVTSYTCFSCGSPDHVRPKCKFRNAVCNVRGLIGRVCQKGGINTMCAEEELPQEPICDNDELYVVYDVNTIFRSEISLRLKFENTNRCMQLDTGCALSLAPISFIKEICPDVKIDPTNVILSTYTGETVRPLG